MASPLRLGGRGCGVGRDVVWGVWYGCVVWEGVVWEGVVWGEERYGRDAGRERCGVRCEGL